MALAAATVWEVRTTGSDANGGAFVTGASGTDRSQQDAAQIAYTDLVLATTTTLTSAAFPFSAAEVGNILNITGGTGFTTGWYQIVSVSVVTATIDRVGGTLGSTGGTGNLGGALATPVQAVTNMVGQNTVYIKKATYLQTVTLTPPSGAEGAESTLYGYNATRGDLDSSTDFTNHPELKMDNATAHVVTSSNAYCTYRNLIANGGVGASKSVNGFRYDGNNQVLINCQAKNCTDFGFRTGTISVIINCQATAQISGARGGFFSDAAGAGFFSCNAVANASPGFWLNAPGTLSGCVSAANTGATSDGI
jgi:hypothetical protein